MNNDSREMRQLTADDYEASSALSMYAFQYTLSPEQQEERRRRFKPEQVWGVFAGDRLEAQLMLLPLRIYVQGQLLDMGGIASVSTWPEQRRRGHVARLLKHALLQMRENGQSVSCLAPFSFGFYRKFGWEIYTDYKTYTVDSQLLPPRAESEGRVERIDAEACIPLLSRLYEDYAQSYNGTLARDDEWWRQSVFRRKKGSAAAVPIADYITSGNIFAYTAPSTSALGRLTVDMPVNVYPNEAWKRWRLVADIVLRNSTRA